MRRQDFLHRLLFGTLALGIGCDDDAQFTDARGDLVVSPSVVNFSEVQLGEGRVRARCASGTLGPA